MTGNDIHSIKKQFTWPISKKLLFPFLMIKLVIYSFANWYGRDFLYQKSSMSKWRSSSLTSYWAEKFIEAPQIISERPSIGSSYKINTAGS